MNPITKTEVLEAIAATEPRAGWASIDMSPITITAGNLRTLIEAAKCANYVNTGGWHKEPPSNSYLLLREPSLKEIEDDESNLP